MALGKAFIEVHADTKPFARELGAELSKILDAAERDVRTGSRKLGSTIADETGKGISQNKNKIGNGVKKSLGDAFDDSQDFFSRLAKGVVDTIDDGLSGLPAEIKVLLGAAIAAALPVAVALGASLATGIISGLTLGGLTAIGALIAFQFTEVREEGERFVSDLRNSLLNIGRFLAGPVIGALDLIRTRFEGMATELGIIFAQIGQVIIPVVDAVVGAFEQFLPGFRTGLRDIGKFLVPLQVGLREIGKAIGDFFFIILSNDDAPEALYDLLILVRDLVFVFTSLVDHGLNFYATLRDIAEFLGIVEESGPEVQELAEKFGIATDGLTGFKQALEGTVSPLEAEQEAVDALNKSLTQYQNLINSNINNQITWEQSLDDFTESVRENGRTLDITTQAGRNNASALLDLANAALVMREDQIALNGDVDAAQLAFEKQRAKIFELAKQMGLSKTATQGLVGELLRIPPPKSSGIDQATIARLNAAVAAAKSLGSALGAVVGIGVNIGVQRRYADGGIVTQPTNALIGEAGAEAVIPLTNPARAAQLLNESGLSNLMGTSVNVYIGNEQLDAYIETRSSSSMTTTARELAYGSRGI